MLKFKPLALALALSSSTGFVFADDQPGTTLKDFFTAAINYSPAIKAAEEQWHAADARLRYATGQMLPQVNAGANVTQNTYAYNVGGPKQDYSGQNYSLQLSQVLFNWQAFASRSQASLQDNQYESQYYAQLALTLTVIADNYLTVLQAEDALASMKSELEAITNQVNGIQKMYDLQLAKITDLYHGQAQLAATQAQLVVAQSDLNIARESLHANSNLDVGPLKRLPDAAPVVPLQGSQEEWMQKARANNKQIEAARFALQAADKGISIREGAYMPKVSLIAGRQRSDVGYNNVSLGTQTDNGYVGVDFQIPLFAGGSNRALVREAESQRNTADAQLKQTVLDVQDRARTAYFKVKSGESRIDAARKLLDATSTSYTAMKRGFELGTVTSVDVLNALRDQFHAQRDLQQARYDYIRYSLVLLREAGTLSASDLEQASNQLNAPALSP
ncbi:MAG TPA: TolC family protein [Candidatus Acidoferrum sp.]|nr:TolC family protein [Candidatus Acidoferrum sp.]